MNNGDWIRLIRQLEDGECTPLLGAGASAHRLPTGGALSQHFAELYGYPFQDADNLPKVTQFAATTQLGDPVDVKRDVCRHLKDHIANTPPAADAVDPYAVLAEFPITTFLTTNYDDLVAQALRKASRDPQVAASQLIDGTSEPGEVPGEPSRGNPLVYHLHGSWDHPDSIVLTDNDFMDYQLSMVSAAASGDRKPLPDQVVKAITGTPLLLIGYSLQDWAFRVLYRSLLNGVRRGRRSISVQLVAALGTHPEAQVRAIKYLEQYLHDWNISTFIGTTDQFFESLRRKMGR
ncbi:SIR2 family protein [Nonomuraea sp. NPDC050310]|uniref:SIR2 family NAD-dependent protein deacylase n=1 Tax=unclassified Nonomuraea TaxID=2593643 RepID=UPI0033FA6E8F